MNTYLINYFRMSWNTVNSINKRRGIASAIKLRLTRWESTRVSAEYFAELIRCFVLAFFLLAYSSTLKMTTTYFPLPYVNFQRTARCVYQKRGSSYTQLWEAQIQINKYKLGLWLNMRISSWNILKLPSPKNSENKPWVKQMFVYFLWLWNMIYYF